MVNHDDRITELERKVDQLSRTQSVLIIAVAIALLSSTIAMELYHPQTAPLEQQLNKLLDD